jgi:hypothetical protein
VYDDGSLSPEFTPIETLSGRRTAAGDQARRVWLQARQLNLSSPESRA